MKLAERAALWDRLAEHSWVEGTMPEAAPEDSAWYIRAMIGVAGWIAAIFVLGFVGVGLAWSIKRGGPSLAAGIVLLGGAALLLRARAGAAFAGQFALAAAFAGQALIAWGLYDLFKADRFVGFLALAVIEVVLVVLITHSVHRVFAAFACVAAVWGALSVERAGGLLPGFIAIAFAAMTLGETRHARHAHLLRPASVGIALALLLFAPATAWGLQWLQPGLRADGSMSASIGAALVAAALVGTVFVLVRRYGIAGSALGASALLTSALIAVAAWQVPGLTGAITIVACAFATGRKALTGLGLVGVAVMLGHYYYSLQTTLLVKSGTLVATGSVLLVAGYVLMRLAGSRAGDNHA